MGTFVPQPWQCGTPPVSKPQWHIDFGIASPRAIFQSLLSGFSFVQYASPTVFHRNEILPGAASPWKIPLDAFTYLFDNAEEIMQAASLGEFEQIVLLALLRLGQEAYGVTVGREIQERTGRAASLGSVYSTLDRLEAKGLVTSNLGEATPERGGRAKRHFQLTPDGSEALLRSQQALSNMKEGLALP